MVCTPWITLPLGDRAWASADHTHTSNLVSPREIWQRPNLQTLGVESCSVSLSSGLVKRLVHCLQAENFHRHLPSPTGKMALPRPLEQLAGVHGPSSWGLKHNHVRYTCRRETFWRHLTSKWGLQGHGSGTHLSLGRTAACVTSVLLSSRLLLKVVRVLPPSPDWPLLAHPHVFFYSQLFKI